MTDGTFRSVRALKREISADQGGSLLKTMAGLWPYIWPSDRRDLKLRVLIAMVLLLLAKLATIAVPFTFKWAVDALTGQGTAPVAPASWLVWVLAAPILMTLAYGGTRILMAVLTQMRDGVFAKVAMHAVRRLAYLIFEHMHQLSLRFHLERKTGGLTRVLERGRNAHRDHRAHGDHAGGADRHRARADRRRAALAVRLALRRGDRRHGRSATWCSPISRPSGASASAAA